MVADVAVLPAGVQEHLGAHDVGLQEDRGVLDAPVYVAFRGEVDDQVGMLCLEQVIDRLPVGDGLLDEAEVGVGHDGGQSLQVAGVGEAVQTDDAVVRVGAEHIVDKVAADEAGAAGDDDSSLCVSHW